MRLFNNLKVKKVVFNNFLFLFFSANALRNSYSPLLEKWFSKFIFGPMYAEKWWLKEYIAMPLRCTSFLMGFKTTVTKYDDILNVFPTTKDDMIIIKAISGMGKSELISRITQAWQNGDERLQEYDYIFVIPLREVRNYTLSLADIICNDLNIVGASALSELKQCLKYSSKRVMILIDAYDILPENEKVSDNIYNGLLQGGMNSEAPYATIVVNTRPDSLHHILRYAQKRKEYKIIHLLGIPETDAMLHWKRALEDEKESDYFKQTFARHIEENIPTHLLHVPIILKMMCFIWKCQVKKHIHVHQPLIFKSVTSIFDTLFGITVGMAEERCRLGDDTNERNIYVYKSLGDDRLPRIIKRSADKICKMSHDCVDRKLYKFSQEDFDTFSIRPIDCSVICFIRVEHRHCAEFIDPIFQHYCAAYHLIQDFETQIQKINNSSDDVETCLGDLSQILTFAVGMKDDVLKYISQCDMRFKLKVYKEYANVDLNLAYMAQLFNECNDASIGQIFANHVSRCQHLSTPAHLLSGRSNTSSLRYFAKALGEEGITILLHNAHGDHISISQDGKISLTGVRGKRCITDPLLLSQLSRTELIDTDILHIRQAELLPLAPKTDFTVKLLHYFLS